MNFKKLLTLCLTLSPVSAFADRLHYQDNKGVLYCQAVCKVDRTEFKAGVYPTNNEGSYLTVAGQWVYKYFITTDGSYEVKAETFAKAQQRCLDVRGQIFAKEPLYSKLQNPELSGISERHCKIYPRVTTDAGALTFEMVAKEEIKTDL